MNMFAQRITVLLACLACAVAAPMPQSGQQATEFADVVDYEGGQETQFDAEETGVAAGPETQFDAGETGVAAGPETQFDAAQTGVAAGQESDPNAEGVEGVPDYYYDSEPEAADAGGFADYQESESNIGHRAARSPARTRGRFGPVRRRQFKLGGFRKPNTKQ